MVQVRATDDGLILQQLLWGDAVRSLKDLDIEDAPVTENELQLALKIIEQGEAERYDPEQYEEKEKQRVLAAIDAKIEGKQIVTPQEEAAADSGQVIDLMEALRASLARNAKRSPSPGRTKPAAPVSEVPAKQRKTVKRAEKAEEPVAAPARTRARR